jgi:hypothetical protein
MFTRAMVLCLLLFAPLFFLLFVPAAPAAAHVTARQADPLVLDPSSEPCELR